MNCKFLILLSIWFLPFAIFVPTSLSSNCDYEKSTITLEAKNRPIGNVLRDIEKQTNYSIEVQHKDVLSYNTSIAFSKTPLDQTLKRLFKNTNYSIICDDENQLLTLVLFGGSSQTNNRESGTSAASTYGNRGATRVTEHPAGERVSSQIASQGKKNRNTTLKSASQTVTDDPLYKMIQAEEEYLNAPPSSQNGSNVEEIESDDVDKQDPLHKMIQAEREYNEMNNKRQ